MFLYGVYVLSEDPPVLSVSDNFIPSLLPLLPAGFSPQLMVFGTWTYEPFAKALAARWRLRRVDRRKTFWMCTTPREAQRLGAVGYPATWCHQNLYCDETLFRPLTVPKKYDAVYTSVIRPYKRLELASAVGSLRLLSGSFADADKLPALGVGHAVVNDRYLDRSEMAAAIAECRVGLALSAEEGGMLACTEYLLCGLPVVSTPSIGGRDVWLDDTNSETVAPAADAVGAAVRRLAADPPDPSVIRAEALRRSRFFRTALSEAVRRVTGRRPFDPEAVDGAWFTRRFVPVHFLGEYLRSYTGSRFDRSDLLGNFAPL